jgi:hypothetical protein
MTSIANPDYKFYKKLEGTWTDEKGTCHAAHAEPARNDGNVLHDP